MPFINIGMNQPRSSSNPRSPSGTNFIVRWDGYVKVPVSGTYNLSTTSDDGSELYIGLGSADERDIVPNNFSQSPTQVIGTTDLLAGYHRITIFYGQGGGGGSMTAGIAPATQNLKNIDSSLYVLAPQSAPIAVIGALSNWFVKPATVVFDGSASGPNADTYSWDFGDGSSGSGATPTHIYANSGTYTVTLVVTDGSGQSSAQATATVKVIGATIDGKFNARMAEFKYTLDLPVGVDVTLPIHFTFGGFSEAFLLKNKRARALNATAVVNGKVLTFTVKTTAATLFGIPVPTSGTKAVNVTLNGSQYVETITFSTRGHNTTFK